MLGHTLEQVKVPLREALNNIPKDRKAGIKIFQL
jgi:hypothetical protein